MKRTSQATLPLFARAMGSQSVAADLERLENRPDRLATGHKVVDGLLGGGLPVGQLTIVAEAKESLGLPFFLETVRTALRRSVPSALLSEVRSELALRELLVTREARVSRERFDAGLISAEDRLARAAARKRLHWDRLTLVAGHPIATSEVDELLFSYRPWLVLAELVPRAPFASRPRRLDSWVEGVERLTSLARKHRTALVLFHRVMNASSDGAPGPEEIERFDALEERIRPTVISLGLDRGRRSMEVRALRVAGTHADASTKLKYAVRTGN